jgi:hypothetical protein
VDAARIGLTGERGRGNSWKGSGLGDKVDCSGDSDVSWGGEGLWSSRS